MHELPRHHHAIGNSRTPPEDQGVTGQRPSKMTKTLGIQSAPEPEVPSHRGHRRPSSEAAQPNESAVPERDRVQRAETLRLTTFGGNNHALLPKEVRNADLRPLLENL